MLQDDFDRVGFALGHEGLDGRTVVIDPELGSPRHYHLPTDTPENLDMDYFMFSVDFAEKLVQRIIDVKL